MSATSQPLENEASSVVFVGKAEETRIDFSNVMWRKIDAASLKCHLGYLFAKEFSSCVFPAFQFCF